MKYTETSARERIFRNGGTIKGRVIDTTPKKARVGIGTLGAIDFLTNKKLTNPPYVWIKSAIREEIIV